MAGDERALDMPGLATIHTLFLREHNRIARQLTGRGLSPERIYQVTRLPVKNKCAALLDNFILF